MRIDATLFLSISILISSDLHHDPMSLYTGMRGSWGEGGVDRSGVRTLTPPHTPTENSNLF